MFQVNDNDNKNLYYYLFRWDIDLYGRFCINIYFVDQTPVAATCGRKSLHWDVIVLFRRAHLPFKRTMDMGFSGYTKWG